ncbi:MAG: DUF3293 domain-containing protein [Acetobacteraceae bacterium]
MTVSPRLLRAYRATTYAVLGIPIRLGSRSRAADALLRRSGAQEGILVTAWNPLSRRMPAGWNHRMQANLRQALHRDRLLPAEGRLGAWHEEHVLVLAPLRAILPVARRFRQAAVVALRPGRPTKLIVLECHGGRHVMRLGCPDIT